MAENDRRAQLLGKFLRVTGERLARLHAGFDQLRSGLDPELIVELKRELHTIKGEARIMGFKKAAEIAHAAEDLFIEAVRVGNLQTYQDALVDALDLIAQLTESGETPNDDVAALADSFIDEARMIASSVAAASDAVRTHTPAAPEAPPAAPVASDDEAPATAEEPVTPGLPITADSSVRVDALHLRALTETAGELVLRHEQLERSIADLDRLVTTLIVEVERASRSASETNLQRRWDRLSRHAFPRLAAYGREMSSTLTRAREESFENRLHLSALQDEIREVRMVRFEDLFTKHARGVRDLARSSAKKIRVVVEGGEVAIDKTVLEHLDEPLLHLVRNALDHGIEPPEERVARGKDERAEIRLHAREAGDHVEVIVADDGRGVDWNAVREKAVRTGVVTASALAAMSDHEVHNLIFGAGFSTRDHSSELSGRGIGLDIVRSQLVDVGGSVRIESTQGQGTRFVLRAPISMAFSKALVFKAGDNTYALPASAVRDVSYLKRDELEVVGEGRALVRDGARVPVMELRALLGGGRARLGPQDDVVVIVLEDSPPLALHVDALSGQRETIRRNLNPFLAGMPLVNGTATVEGRRLVLFLDLIELRKRAGMRGATVQRAEAASDTASGEERRCRVLFVDDSDLTRDMVVSLLERGGFDVREASDGAEALAALAAEKPDIVVTDLDMPVMDGFALIRKARTNPEWRDLPMLVMSTRGSESDKKLAMEAGADGYVVKSGFRAEDFLEMLRVYAKGHA